MNTTLYLAGRVRRWHTHPSFQQSLADHSWGVAMIIAMEHPNPSVNLLKAALLHDLHELETGDITPQGKKIYQINGDEEDFAKSWLAEQGVQLQKLTEEEEWWLNYADKAEAVLFLAHNGGKDVLRSHMIDSAITKFGTVLREGAKK